jgi:hypothetical protein
MPQISCTVQASGTKETALFHIVACSLAHDL